jgi:hypothetical protein
MNELVKKFEINTSDINKEKLEELKILDNKSVLMNHKYFYVNKTSNDDILKKKLIESHLNNLADKKMDKTINNTVKGIYNKFPKYLTKDYVYIENMEHLNIKDIIYLVPNDISSISKRLVIKRIKKIGNVIINITVVFLDEYIGITTLSPKKFYVFKYNVDELTKKQLLDHREDKIQERLNDIKYRSQGIIVRKKQKKNISDFVYNVLSEVKNPDKILKNNEYLTMDASNLKKNKEELQNEMKKLKKTKYVKKK